jgi:hypothetical protein
VLQGRAVYAFPRAYGVPVASPLADDSRPYNEILGGATKKCKPQTDDDERVTSGVDAAVLYGDWRDGEATRVAYFPGVGEATAAQHRAMTSWLEGGWLSSDEKAAAAAAAAAAAEKDSPGWEPYEAARVVSGGGDAEAGDEEENNAVLLTARRELREGEVVGFVSGVTRAVDPTSVQEESGGGGGGGGAPRRAQRWRPSDRMFVLSDHPDMPAPPEDGSGLDPEGGGGAGGVFLVAAGATQGGDTEGADEDDNDEDTKKAPSPRRQRMKTRCLHAPSAVRDAWTCRREPFAHPILGDCLALVAESAVPVGGAITQPPDYAAGWRLDPRSVGRCKFNSVDPYLESDWFQPLSL